MFNNYENNYIFKILLKVYYMQVRGGLKSIFKKMGNTIKNDLDTIIENNVENSFGKFKNKIGGLLEYSYERLGEIKNDVYYGLQKVKDGISEYGTIIKDKIKRLSEYLDKKSKEIKYKILEYGPKIAFSALPSPARVSISEGLYIINADKSLRGRLIGYVLIIVGGATAVVSYLMFGLHAIHSLPSNNVHVQYLGSQNGYIEFVPNGQTINYDGHTDPVGDLIFNNGNTINDVVDVVWDGQYASTIIQNHNQIVQLNSQFVGQTDPINGQQYVPLQDLYVIKGQVPIEEVTINGQAYFVIDANNINPGDVAGFYTYQGWVTNFVEAMNTPGTYAAGLPGNSPVFTWDNLTGTVAYQTVVYQHYIRGFAGGAVLVQPNRTIIPYGVNTNIPASVYFSNFEAPPQVYNSSS